VFATGFRVDTNFIGHPAAANFSAAFRSLAVSEAACDEDKPALTTLWQLATWLMVVTVEAVGTVGVVDA
jgi:hypothetical protein